MGLRGLLQHDEQANLFHQVMSSKVCQENCAHQWHVHVDTGSRKVIPKHTEKVSWHVTAWKESNTSFVRTSHSVCVCVSLSLTLSLSLCLPVCPSVPVELVRFTPRAAWRISRATSYESRFLLCCAGVHLAPLLSPAGCSCDPLQPS